MRSVLLKFFTLLIFSASLSLIYMITKVKWHSKEFSQVHKLTLNLEYVIVHIDLKGSPPRLEYLTKILPELKKHGANGLLMEYEDMFPYEGKLVNISARDCYKKTELRAFLQSAVKFGFEVIPLVQTFGHLEHVLKLQQFRHLRESPLHPDSICPSKQESKELLRLIFEQVINFHNGIAPLKYVHVGCDEVFQMKICSQCRERMLLEIDIFLGHIKYISSVVKDLSANTTVLIWDDMLRKEKPNQLSKIEHFDKIEPVYWDYSSQMKLNRVSLFYYHQIFRNIWTASAFKGADGIATSFPSLKKRVENNLEWMNVMSNFTFAGEDRVYSFKGIILTGWSRYSHMDPPCELLPVSYPSLIINLIIVEAYKHGVSKKLELPSMNKDIRNNVIKSLQCDDNTDIMKGIDSCNFDGVELFRLVKDLDNLINSLQRTFWGDVDLFTFERYFDKKYININRWSTNVDRSKKLLQQINDLEKKLYTTMELYFYDDFIKEYIAFKTAVKSKILGLNDKLLYGMNWTRGPVTV